MTQDSSMSASENGHTARWWVSEATDAYGSKLVMDEEGLVAAVTTDDDARLIAAAPDLLRELKFQVRNCPVCKGTAKAVDVFDILSSDGPHEKKDCQRCSGARTAISKAEGGAA